MGDNVKIRVDFENGLSSHKGLGLSLVLLLEEELPVEIGKLTWINLYFNGVHINYVDLADGHFAKDFEDLTANTSHPNNEYLGMLKGRGVSVDEIEHFVFERDWIFH